MINLRGNFFKHVVLSENENTTYRNLWDIAKQETPPFKNLRFPPQESKTQREK